MMMKRKKRKVYYCFASRKVPNVICIKIPFEANTLPRSLPCLPLPLSLSHIIDCRSLRIYLYRKCANKRSAKKFNSILLLHLLVEEKKRKNEALNEHPCGLCIDVGNRVVNLHTYTPFGNSRQEEESV